MFCIAIALLFYAYYVRFPVVVTLDTYLVLVSVVMPEMCQKRTVVTLRNISSFCQAFSTESTGEIILRYFIA